MGLIGCIWPHKWTEWYPGRQMGNFNCLYYKTKHCTRCGKVKERRGWDYIAATSWEYRAMRREAGVE